jgi:TRAP-type C4-dicarboxylate transport system substrate-binding protein
MVMSKKRLDALTESQRAAVLDTGKVAAKALTDRIRGEDAKAFERLQKKMTVVEPTPEELVQWKKLFAEARVRLGKGTLDPKLMEEAEKFSK